jgi:hypothetical protein
MQVFIIYLLFLSLNNSFVHLFIYLFIYWLILTRIPYLKRFLQFSVIAVARPTSYILYETSSTHVQSVQAIHISAGVHIKYLK